MHSAAAKTRPIRQTGMRGSVRIGSPDCANVIWHDELMGNRSLFVLHRKPFAVESLAFTVQSTYKAA